jgi:predicted nuclease of predicted toxin-antitoxin system
MTIVADESVDKQIVERLRQEGYEVLYIAEMEPSISDNTVLQRANEKNALLITSDKDFGELVFRQKLLSSGGIVLLRLSGLSNQLKAETVVDAFAKHVNDFIQAFSVVSPGAIRIRPNS